MSKPRVIFHFCELFQDTGNSKNLVPRPSSRASHLAIYSQDLLLEVNVTILEPPASLSRLLAITALCINNHYNKAGDLNFHTGYYTTSTLSLWIKRILPLPFPFTGLLIFIL